MSTREEVEAIFRKHHCDDFRWIAPQQIVVAHWVRMKCLYGCGSYGHKAGCPPNTPAVEECRAFVGEYRTAAIFHFAAALPERQERERWLRGINAHVLSMEREVFLAGYQKAFALPAARCRMCEDCQERREECVHPETGRPTVEAMAIDVYTTAHSAGYPVQVLTDPAQEMNRFAILLLE